MNPSIERWLRPQFLEPFYALTGIEPETVERTAIGFADAMPILSLRSIVATQRPMVIPGISNRGWYNASEFSEAAALEAAHPAILKELNAIRNTEPELQDYPEPGIEVAGTWRHFPLARNGALIPRNSNRCPETVKAAYSIGSIEVPGRTYFSALIPDTHISAHRGPHNFRLRLHLGLDVPPNCSIRVGNETRTWEPGKCIVFNDFCEHEVWNNGASPRMVFITDLWHPELKNEEVLLLRYLLRTITPGLFRPELFAK